MKKKYHYTVVTTAYNGYCDAYEERTHDFLHRRDDLTGAGVMRILRGRTRNPLYPEPRISDESQLVRVEVSCWDA